MTPASTVARQTYLVIAVDAPEARKFRWVDGDDIVKHHKGRGKENKDEVLEVVLTPSVSKVDGDGRDNVLESTNHKQNCCLVVITNCQDVADIDTVPLAALEPFLVVQNSKTNHNEHKVPNEHSSDANESSRPE